MLNTVSLGQRNKHIFILFLLQFCLLLILLAGCGKDNSASKTESVAAEKRIQEETAPGSDQSYSVMDDTGRKIVMKEKPKRIVSVTYGTDEILKVLAGPERIAAYSRHAGEPEISFLSAEDVKRQKGGKQFGIHLWATAGSGSNLYFNRRRSAKNIGKHGHPCLCGVKS